MKQIIKFSTKIAVVFLALMGLFITSCQKELLDPIPLTSYSDASVFTSPERIQQQVNGIYAALKNGQFYGGRFVVYHEIRGENYLNETTNGVTGFQTWNHTIVSSTNEVATLWGAAYTTINRVNVFLEGLEANKGVVGNNDLVNNYLGEARFVRAVTYFSLLSLYARPFADGNGNNLGVPLRLLSEKSGANNDLARATVAQVYALILEDLNFAEQNLPANYSTAFNNTTRAHRNTAIAFKTRVLLHMGRYTDVIVEANKIVTPSAPFQASSGVPHALQANIANVFKTPYTTTESIFSMPFTENNLPGTQNGLGSYFNPGPRGIGDYSINLNGLVADPACATADPRRQFIVVNAANNKPYMNKFPTGPQHLDYLPIIRYSEVLLNLAEAIARTSGTDERAIALLNAVRGRSDDSVQFSQANFASANDLVEVILKERQIELLGEGFRSLDLMRLLRPLPAKANVPAIEPARSEYIWPIPDSELAVNKLIVQNP
ncbi:MAG TPA: RagB/SusD family nutrient uptake outer membrane protein [Saprospiraceae bacterium]|nr:RagB/SusD family nutrient uptake outer membrane protein [Saprospiraceae bacterium]